MLALALAWLLGTLLALRGWLPAWLDEGGLWLTGITTLLALLLWRQALPADGRPRLAWQTTALLATAVTAMSWTSAQLNAQLADRWPDREQASTVQIQAHIVELPRQLDDRWSFVLQLQQPLSHADGQLAAGSRISVNWYRAELDQGLRPGDCASWILQLRGTRGPVNAAGWEPERLALLQRRNGRASVKARLAECEPQGGLDRFRDSLSRRIDAALPASPSRASLKALSLGDTREFDDAQWEGLRATGLTHLMAISGLHIGLLAGFGVLLGRSLYRLAPGLAERWPRPLAEALLAMSLASGYAALAGFALPTQRALAALAAFLLARLLRRSISVWSAYAIALLVVLLIDPLAPLGAGFWLSFGAVAWLLYLFARGAQKEARWRSLLRAQLLLSLALAPLTALWFGQGSLAGPLLNLLAVPWVALVAVPASLLAMMVVMLAPALAQWPLQAVSQLLRPLWWLVEQVGGAAAPVGQFSPGLAAVLLASIGVAWLFAPAGVRGRALGLLLWLPLLWPARQTPEPGAVWMTVLDVGQGQAVLLQTAGHALLVDAGPAAPGGFDSGEAIVVPVLQRLGVQRLDALLLSHGDQDHAGGAAAVRQALQPRALWGRLPRVDPQLDDCLSGQSWTWDGVQFEILHPPLHFPYLGNDSSCVLRIEDAHGGRLLIPGDIGQIIEQRLVREQPTALRAQVLIAPHHGSNSSSSAAFLAAVGAEQVIYSAGWGNRFGMPRGEVLTRAAATGAQQWSTARSGMLAVHSDGQGGFELSSERDRQPLPWRGADLGQLESSE